ncbi:MAG: hypothetical protein SFW67_09435 [Myxococcaceae bacterium]|nr:hypothetical protein [Myxococcaceae bacterium]
MSMLLASLLVLVANQAALPSAPAAPLRAPVTSAGSSPRLLDPADQARLAEIDSLLNDKRLKLHFALGGIGIAAAGVPIVVTGVVGAFSAVAALIDFNVTVGILLSPIMAVFGFITGPFMLLQSPLTIGLVAGGLLLVGVAAVADLSYQAGRRSLVQERKAILATLPATEPASMTTVVTF